MKCKVWTFHGTVVSSDDFMEEPLYTITYSSGSRSKHWRHKFTSVHLKYF